MQSQRHVVNTVGLALSSQNFSYDTRGAATCFIEDELGLQKIGGGAYGSVFRHPSDYSLVVKVGFDPNDGWLDYAAFCIENPGHPELMQVHDLRVFSTFWVAVMEKLDATEDFSYGGSKYGMRRDWETGDNLPLGAQRLWNKVGRFTDLHGGNMMLRDGFPVITDPYCVGEGYYQKFKAANGRIDVTIGIYNVSDEQVLKELQYAGPNGAPVVAVGKAATVRAQKENTVLRSRPVHADPARSEGVQRALLPKLGSRRVQTARGAVLKGNTVPFGGYQRFAKWANNFAGGRNFGAKREVSMAASGRYQFFPRVRIPDSIQPEIEPRNTSNLQPERVAWHYRSLGLRRKA